MIDRMRMTQGRSHRGEKGKRTVCLCVVAGKVRSTKRLEWPNCAPSTEKEEKRKEKEERKKGSSFCTTVKTPFS